MDVWHCNRKTLNSLFIVYCRAKSCICFIYRECSYYSQMIIHDVSSLHSGLLTKICLLTKSFVLFCDEETFSRKGVFNTHNMHIWALNNPHSNRPRIAQQRFTINALASIVEDSFLGTYILLPRLESDKYLMFLQDVLPEMLTHVPSLVQRPSHMVSTNEFKIRWFQQDGEKSHYGKWVRD